MIIAIQCHIVFCHTTMGISHKYTYVPSPWASLSPLDFCCGYCFKIRYVFFFNSRYLFGANYEPGAVLRIQQWAKQNLWSQEAYIARMCRRCRLDPWFGKIPWRKKWQLTLVLLPGKSHGQTSLAGYSPWVTRESHRT